MNTKIKDNLLVEGNHWKVPEPSEMNFEIVENEEDPFDDDIYLDREYRIYKEHLAEQKKNHVSILLNQFKNLLQKYGYNPNNVIHIYYESLPPLELEAYVFDWYGYSYSTEIGVIALKFEHKRPVTDQTAARILRTVMNEAMFNYDAQENQFTYYLPIQRFEHLIQDFNKPGSTKTLLEVIENTLANLSEDMYEDYLRYLHIISIKKPLVTYFLNKQVLQMHLIASEENFEIGHTDCKEYIPNFEMTLHYSLLTEEEIEMAKFLEDLNDEANGARTFNWQAGIIALEGFEIFQIPLPAYLQSIKKEWYQKKVNIPRIRKRKIRAALKR